MKFTKDYCTSTFKHFLLFCTGGGLGALINWAITVLLVELFSWWYLTAYIVGIAINLVFNFNFQQRITFKVVNETKKRFIKFLATSLSTIFLNIGIVYFLTDILGLFYLLSIMTATLGIAIINYVLNKNWVFRE